MGTRADFYIGKGKTARWIGSLAWDGYEWDQRIEKNDPDAITEAKNENDFKSAVTQVLKDRIDATTPKMGWPWPWDDSQTTDFSYCFVNDHIEAFCFGKPISEEDHSKTEWPAMNGSDYSAKPGDIRSGLLVVATKG